ncbi:MAG TPA: exodeoxyribonuclease V subunit gamma [Kofleriaceae bacterium]|nr:exodeoxyribonuclease V subunit gamma [Kofleriaceae bacterium]
MLRAVHSNRVEDLFSALLDALPAPDPFAPTTIVVGSQLVARWLSRELAFARGIAAGVELVTFDRFVEQVWAQDAAGKRANLAALDRGRLGAAFASVLADASLVARLPAVQMYLDAAPAPGDRAGPRRVQLAEHLASLTWSYALSRPDWMPALVAGHVPGELADDPTARWQAALIGAALSRLPDDRRWAPAPMLPWLRRRAGLPAPQLARPVAAFGMSFLARAQLEALTDLAETTDVTVYILDPCQELWDDVGGRRQLVTTDATAAIDPLPLVMWGRPVRDTLSALVERTGGDLDAQFSQDDGGSARARLLADVRDRKPPSEATACAEHGVRVFACPNPRREVEVIAGEIRKRLDADPTLSAHEIALWIAGDAEYYLAQAPSAFEAVGVPCHLIDAPIDDRGRIGEAVLALLELPTSTMARRDLLRVMTHPAVLAGHPHVDAADWVRWTERLGIAHGADGTAHEGTYLADHPGHFHWDQGVRRLALGAFMVGERASRGAVSIGRTQVAPEELRPDEQASAATYALLVRSLCADAAWLAVHEAPLAKWADVLAALVDEYLAPRDEEATRDLERVRAMLAALAHLDVDGRPVGFREVREHVIRQLGKARANRGEPLASGVMIAPLAAMRAIPYRIAFVAGLDEGAFPASDQASPLDLRKTARVGDVSPRDRDRAAFLDVLLSAREALYLSYVATEPKSGQALGPSSVVLELADAIAPYVGAASSREALEAITERHPLHRFGGDASALVPAVARERWACRVRDQIRDHLRAAGHPIPDEDGQLALLAHPAQASLRAALGVEDAPSTVAQTVASRSLSISNLRGFLEHPIQAWAQAVLGLDELPDDVAAEHSDEPFHLARSERAVLLREVFAAHLREPARPLEQCYDVLVEDAQLRGQFPVGVFAEAARALDLETLETWLASTRGLALDRATRIGFGRAFSRGATLEPALTLELSGSRTVQLVGQTELLARSGSRYASLVPMLRKLENRTAYHLRGAFDHVVLAAAGIANDGHVHRLLDPQGRSCEVHHEPWSQRDARAYLAAIASELLDHCHGYLLPFEALVKGLAGGKPSARNYGDPTNGLGYGPIERRDGLRLPPDVHAIAARRLGPLVERMRGEHGFEMTRSSAPRISRGTQPPYNATAARTATRTPAAPDEAAPTTESAPRGALPKLTIIRGGLP